jgi:hypothetical protein
MEKTSMLFFLDLSIYYIGCIYFKITKSIIVTKSMLQYFDLIISGMGIELKALGKHSYHLSHIFLVLFV